MIQIGSVVAAVDHIVGPCTVVQLTATHAQVIPDALWRDSVGNFIQPWLPLGSLTLVRGVEGAAS